MIQRGSQAVNVGAVVALVASNFFRGDVVGRSPDAFCATLTSQRCEPEVNEFGMAFFIKQDVFRLDVPVYKIRFVGRLKGLRHFHRHSYDLALRRMIPGVDDTV